MGWKMRFAVVEDNETLANGIAHQLRDQGHSVDVLHDGAEALTFLRQDGRRSGYPGRKPAVIERS